MRRCHSLSIDIVGGGFGMISILDQMNQHGLSCSDIRIYSADHAEIGDAYRPAPNLLLMNTKTQHLGFFDHVVNFAAWLARQPENRDRPKDFIPRAVFGAYLSEVRTEIERALLRRGNRLQRLGPATRIDREARVHKEDEAGPPSDLILLSPGYGRALDLVALANNILSMPCNGRVRIVGSGLSAIDLILLSEHLRPDLAIECISLSGRLPRIRSNFGGGGRSILAEGSGLIENASARRFLGRLIALSANEIERRLLLGKFVEFEHELQYVQAHVPSWQPALYDSTQDYARFFSRLSRHEQDLLFRLRPKFIETRVMFPIVNAVKLKKMRERGQLLFSARRLAQEDMAASNTICAFNSLAHLKNFIVASELPVHRLAGVDCDLNGRVPGRRPVYAMGPITNGVRYFTEASSLTRVHARLAVQSGLSEASARPSSTRIAAH